MIVHKLNATATALGARIRHGLATLEVTKLLSASPPFPLIVAYFYAANLLQLCNPLP